MRLGNIVLVVFIANFLLAVGLALEFVSLATVYSVVVSFCMVLLAYWIREDGDDIIRLEKEMEEMRKRIKLLEQK